MDQASMPGGVQSASGEKRNCESVQAQSLPNRINFSINASQRLKVTAPATQVQLVPGKIKNDDFRLDGELKEKFWNDALKLCEFRNSLNPEILSADKTELLMRQDKDSLYLGWRCYGDMSKLKSEIRNSESAVFRDDNIEIFLNPGNAASGPYYQFCMNASGSKADLECTEVGLDSNSTDNTVKRKRDSQWKCEWQGKTSLHPDRWEAEIVLPVSQLNPKGDLWHFLAGRNNRSREETVSIPAIGKFDQPEKYLPFAFSLRHDGKGSIQKWPLSSFLGGSYKTGLFNLGRDGNVAIAVMEKNGNHRNSMDPIIKGKADLIYDLLPGDKLWEMSITDMKGTVQLNYQLPLKVPDLMKTCVARQIFFHNENMADQSFDAVIDIALDQESRSGVQLEIMLCPGKAILHRKTLELTEDSFDLHLPLSGFSCGFYTMEARLLENGKEKAMKQLPFIIFPE